MLIPAVPNQTKPTNILQLNFVFFFCQNRCHTFTKINIWIESCAQVSYENTSHNEHKGNEEEEMFDWDEEKKERERDKEKKTHANRKLSSA